MKGLQTFAVLPVKALAQAKGRLASVLPESVRQRLVLAMLEDVLAAVAQVDGITRMVVVTPDAAVARIAEIGGAVIVPEPGAGQLNAAVETGIAFALSHGAARALVLPADIPLASTGELAGLVGSRTTTPSVTLVPSHDSNGTNALLLAPPSVITPCYGPGSYLQHMSQAMARQIDVNVLHLAGVARDIDEPADLAVLCAAAEERYGFAAPYLAAAGWLSRGAAAEEQ
jgi:2-phospho-L-lactate guanylyltransferase